LKLRITWSDSNGIRYYPSRTANRIGARSSSISVLAVDIEHLALQPVGAVDPLLDTTDRRTAPSPQS